MWECKKCCEPIEDSFDACWRCGTSSEGVEDASFQSEAQSNTDARPRERQTLSTCAKCGARQVIPARVIDREGGIGRKDLAVWVDRDPDAWVLKRSVVVELKACVCGSCGYTELYATNPSALWSAYGEQGGE